MASLRAVKQKSEIRFTITLFRAPECVRKCKVDNEAMINTDAIEFHILPKHQTRKEHIKLA